MKPKFTIAEFRQKYPDDAACLDRIFQLRFGNLEDCPNCYREANFRRITTRRAYQCRYCYHQLYPTAGTVFEKTTTPLTYWFYAIYLMTVTRNGVAAKELERQLGVTYKCAFRMAHKIRELMGEYGSKLLGFVEIDEAYIGGKEGNKHKDVRNKDFRGRSLKSKSVVFGMVERQGKIKAFKVQNAKAEHLIPKIQEHVSTDAKISTDELPAYQRLSDMGYNHESISHAQEEYRRGSVCTNTIEGYFSQLKRAIYGTHIHVSGKYLQRYVSECSFRYNNRTQPTLMFEKILENLPSA